MNCSQIERIFFGYLQNDVHTRALLINGEWGSGKTYFWDKCLSEIAKKENLTPIRISLGGINSIDAIEQGIARKILTPTFEAIEQKKDSKVWRTIKSLGKLASSFAEKQIGIDIVDLVTKNVTELHDFSKDVICFDDLERCALPIKEIMGYIGNWIEICNAKVVILVNENEIGFGQENRDQVKILYQNTKEKLVAFSCDFHQNISDIFDQLTSHLDERIRNQKELIIDLCNTFGIINLRTIKTFLHLAQRAISHIDAIYNFQIEGILAFILFISNETCRGNISSKNIKDVFELNDIDHIAMLDAIHEEIEKSENSVEKSYGVQFYETYLKTCPCNFDFYPSLLRYILTGLFDEDAFKSEVSKCREKEIRPEYKILNAFQTRHFSEFEEDEFKSKIKELFKYALKGCYELNEYYSIAAILFKLSDLKLINYSPQRICSMSKIGISVAKQKYRYSENETENSFLMQAQEIPQMNDIYDMIKRAKSEIRAESLKLTANEFIDILTDTTITEVKLNNFTKVELYSDFIIYINKKAFIKALSLTSNAKINYISDFFRARYRTYQNLKNLRDELDWIQETKTNTEKLLSAINKKNTIKRYNLNQFINTINNIIKSCANTPA